MSVTRHDDFEGPEFLFQYVLEKGILAFITGNPGATKTLVVLEIAARLTKGKLPGDMDGPINVLYVSIEGTFKRSIGPRFVAAGGIRSRFHHVNKVIWLPSDLKELERLIKLHKAGLVIVDPIKDHFDPKVNSSTQITAQCLAQIQALAERTGCTILGVDWPSKSARKGDLSVSGNQAFTGTPRQTIVVGRLDRDEYVVGVSKASDSAMYTGWIYGVEAKEIGVDRNNKPLTPRVITWLRPAKPSEVMRAREQANIEEDPDLRAMLQFMSSEEEFITKALTSWLVNELVMGQKKADKLIKGAKAAGYLSTRTEAIRDDNNVARGYLTHWKITPGGVLKLAMNEEVVEAAIEELFPTMEITLNDVIPNRHAALPAARTKRVIPRITKSGAS